MYKSPKLSDGMDCGVWRVEECDRIRVSKGRSSRRLQNELPQNLMGNENTATVYILYFSYGNVAYIGYSPFRKTLAPSSLTRCDRRKDRLSKYALCLRKRRFEINKVGF